MGKGRKSQTKNMRKADLTDIEEMLEKEKEVSVMRDLNDSKLFFEDKAKKPLMLTATQKRELAKNRPSRYDIEPSKVDPISRPSKSLTRLHENKIINRLVVEIKRKEKGNKKGIKNSIITNANTNTNTNANTDKNKSKSKKRKLFDVWSKERSNPSPQRKSKVPAIELPDPALSINPRPEDTVVYTKKVEDYRELLKKNLKKVHKGLERQELKPYVPTGEEIPPGTEQKEKRKKKKKKKENINRVIKEVQEIDKQRELDRIRSTEKKEQPEPRLDKVYKLPGNRYYRDEVPNLRPKIKTEGSLKSLIKERYHSFIKRGTLPLGRTPLNLGMKKKKKTFTFYPGEKQSITPGK